jgi:hypothetical protein
MKAVNMRILSEACWMQNIDSGIDRFCRHCILESPITCVISIQKGFHGAGNLRVGMYDHSLAIRVLPAWDKVDGLRNCTALLLCFWAS